MEPFEIIGHTSDIGIKVNGATLKELFENAARGMFAVIFGEDKYPGSLKSKEQSALNRRKIQIKKEIYRYEELLVFWLSELLYIFNQEPIICEDFFISELNNSCLTSEVAVRKVDFITDMINREIKAVTFSGLDIEENEHGFTCKVIFDV